MNSQLDFVVRMISKELWSRRKLVVFLYIFSSIGFLIAAWTWPRIYTSTSVISVDQASTLGSLMQGAAVTTEVRDKANIARQIIFSRASIEKILSSEAWNSLLDEQPLSDKESVLNSNSINPVIDDDNPQEEIPNQLAAVSAAITESTNTDKVKDSSKEDLDTSIAAELNQPSLVIEETSKLNISAKEFDSLSMRIKDNTTIENLGGNLIKISYKDAEPRKAYATARLLSTNFIDDSLKSKQLESRSAFDFIDNQVSIYDAKLKQAEGDIKDFLSKNIESTPGAKENANTKLIELRGALETAELEISAEEASIVAMYKRLKGEVSFDQESLDREAQLNTRVVEMENRLSNLRLSYLESYPDIVQVKTQIAALNQQLLKEKNNRSLVNLSGKEKTPSGAVADGLRRQILVSGTNISTLKSRIVQLQIRVEKEKLTLGNINEVEAEMSQLTRDHEVNQTMYQTLLERRENARISMNMDIEDQGLTIKIQEGAVLPVTPKGIRFSHIILAGLLISFLIPIGIVYALTLVDEKVRNASFFRETFQVPVLGSVYQLLSPAQRRTNILKLFIMLSIIFVVWSVYGYAIWLRIQG